MMKNVIAGGLLHIGDHLIDDDPFPLKLVEGKQFEVIKVIHFHVHLRHGDGVDDFNGNNVAFEWLAGVFWALAVFNPIQVLGDGLKIRLAGGIPKQQGAGIVNGAEKMNIAFVNTFEVNVGQDTGDGCRVFGVIFHVYCVFGRLLLCGSGHGDENGGNNREGFHVN